MGDAKPGRGTVKENTHVGVGKAKKSSGRGRRSGGQGRRRRRGGAARAEPRARGDRGKGRSQAVNVAPGIAPVAQQHALGSGAGAAQVAGRVSGGREGTRGTGQVKNGGQDATPGVAQGGLERGGQIPAIVQTALSVGELDAETHAPDVGDRGHDRARVKLGHPPRRRTSPDLQLAPRRSVDAVSTLPGGVRERPLWLSPRAFGPRCGHGGRGHGRDRRRADVGVHRGEAVPQSLVEGAVQVAVDHPRNGTGAFDSWGNQAMGGAHARHGGKAKAGRQGAKVAPEGRVGDMDILAHSHETLRGRRQAVLLRDTAGAKHLAIAGMSAQGRVLPPRRTGADCTGPSKAAELALTPEPRPGRRCRRQPATSGSRGKRHRKRVRTAHVTPKSSAMRRGRGAQRGRRGSAQPRKSPRQGLSVHQEGQPDQKRDAARPVRVGRGRAGMQPAEDGLRNHGI